MCNWALSRRTGPFLAGWPMLAVGTAVLGAFHTYFSDVMVLLGFRKVWWVRLLADYQTATMTFFGCKFGFGKCFGSKALLLGPTTELVIAGCCIQSTFHHISQSDWEMVRCCVEWEDDTSNWWFFLNFDQFKMHPLIEVFHLSNLLQMTIVLSMLSSLATSHVAVKESVLMILSIGHYQFMMASNYTLHLQGSCLLCRTPLTTTALCVH